MGGCASREDVPSVERIVVLGASGMVGAATVTALAADPQGKEIVAAVRNPDSDKTRSAFAGLDNIEVVAGDMGSPESLDTVLRRASTVFIVVPGHVDRTQLAMNAIEACARADVHHILLLSVLLADRTDLIFGKQFAPLEAKVKDCGIDYTIMRLPMFMENNYGHVDSIKGQQMVYGPIPAEKTHNPIAVADVGAGAGAMLTDPKKFSGRTVLFTTSPTGYGTAVTQGFSLALGKEISYTQVPFEGAKEAFMGMGMPEWQVDGVLELIKGVEDDYEEYQHEGHFEEVAGRKPQTVEEWCHANNGAFKDT